MHFDDTRRPVALRPRPPAPSSLSGVATLAVYGCEDDEAALFRRLAPDGGFLPVITSSPVSVETVGLARGSRCVSVGHKTPVTNPTLLALGAAGVEHVSTRSVGVDHIDVDYAAGVGITVGTVGYSPDSVADYTLMLMLMALRHAKSVLRSADVHDYRLGERRGRELRDLTVGVVGTGRIGTAVIDRLRGFGCRILACDARPTAAAEHVPLDELVDRSDVVTLHTPLTPRTHHLLDRRRIGRLRPGAIVVNTGRGALLDTDALLGALEHGTLGGAALDVLEGEAGVFYADHRKTPLHHEALVRLQRLPDAIVSPHIAYFTDHALRDTVANSIADCRTAVRGGRHA